jgi:hypothetical protein
MPGLGFEPMIPVFKRPTVIEHIAALQFTKSYIKKVEYFFSCGGVSPRSILRSATDLCNVRVTPILEGCHGGR